MDYLDLIERRGYSFRLVQAVLRDQDLPTAQGWEPLKEKVQGLANAKDPKFIEKLKSITIDLTLYAEKAVALFPLSNTEALNIPAILGGIKPAGMYATNFPFLLSDAALTAQPTSLQPAHHLLTGQKLGNLVFATKFYETTRAKIEVADFNSIPAELQGYDEVIAIRRTIKQLFHLVTLRATKKGNFFLEIRLDTVAKMVEDDFRKGFRAVRRWMNKQYASAFGVDDLLDQEVNMFPAIKGLYAAADGRVRHLGSTTTSASVKQERMRSKFHDLRMEPFHVAGQKVTALDSYSIDKNWDSWLGSGQPSVIVPGKVADISSDDPHVGMVFVDGAGSIDDFELVMEKLIDSLGL
ncbi:hypothetical protein RDV84_23840 [Lysobacter yananisis]|uniref:Uncharacterized protein n=1 Tax=Lysobacter yananisis TaxID=1003114 RepID=A0ABY9P7B7_9GAMM|nr:hypothetical protein [Lysobacter yananisis]WMT02958.1 hypothetical protein RDV84_23840 [Lysobacter yananisis]